MGELKQGMKVRSSDGESLGKVIQIESESFLVEKGFFFPKDYSIPFSLVSGIQDDEVSLSASRDELQHQMEGGERYETHREERSVPAEGEERMQLSEEELEARKRVHEAGAVTVKKEVVTEHRQIEVPVTKEEVHVERVPASAAGAPQGEAFKEETIRVPVREEEVEVTKKPRVREEVRVSKTPRQEERRVEGEVRREEARVERTGSTEPPRSASDREKE